MIKLYLAAKGRAQKRRYVRTTVASPKKMIKNRTLGETCAAPEEQKYVSVYAGLREFCGSKRFTRAPDEDLMLDVLDFC